MISLILLRLKTDEFQDSIGPLLPSPALRRQLLKSPEVSALVSALRFGEVTADDVRGFVGDLVKEFRVGEYFHHNLALAAMAVAVETWGSPLAEEFLLDLARLKAPELNISTRVARECLQRRYALPLNEVRETYYPVTVARRFTSRGMRISDLSAKPEEQRWSFPTSSYKRVS